jgi:glycosyltransferase involved in cell wall biosynthesis
MKVGIYLGHIDPNDGGGWTFQHSILKALELVKETHHEFVLLYRSNEQPMYRLANLSLTPPVAFRIIAKLRRVLTRPSASFLNLSVVQKKIDIIWFPTYQFEPVNCPYIFTVWDLQHRLQPFFPEVSQAGEWEKRENHYLNSLKKATFVLTGTNRGAEEISLFYQIHPDRIRKLPHPLPELVDGSKLPADFPMQLIGKYLFYPAQFWPHKNHIRIIQALGILKQVNISVPVVFAGSDKGNKNHVEELAKELGVRDQIQFLGFVAAEHMTVLYSNALALVYPTLFGPENLPPLEAMSKGCPAIVSNVPGSLEQYGEAVLYFDPASAVDLADKIKMMLNPAIRQQQVEKQKSRNVYTSKNYVDDIVRILDEFAPIHETWKR